jgi:hypothetical protein
MDSFSSWKVSSYVLCVNGIKFASLYDFAIGHLNFSDSAVFVSFVFCYFCFCFCFVVNYVTPTIVLKNVKWSVNPDVIRDISFLLELF